MDTKHTPGPWIINLGESGIDIISTSLPYVAQVFSASFSGIDEEQKANASLIAAAPDLLQALQYLLANPGYHIAEGEARSAISKAIGKEA